MLYMFQRENYSLWIQAKHSVIFVDMVLLCVDFDINLVDQGPVSLRLKMS